MLSLANSRGLFFYIPKFSGDHCLPIIAKSWESNVKNSLPKVVARSIGKLFCRAAVVLESRNFISRAQTRPQCFLAEAF